MNKRILIVFGVLAMMPAGAQIRHGAPLIEFNDDGGWCWFEDERAIVAGGKLILGTIATAGARLKVISHASAKPAKYAPPSPRNSLPQG